MNLISTRYSFASAYLKGEEARSIMSDHIDGLLQRTKTLQDMLDIIRDTDIGEYLNEHAGNLKTFDDIDDMLWRYVRECIDRLRRFTLPAAMSRLLDVYLKKYDIQNIKNAVRGIMDATPPSAIPLGTIFDEGYLDDLAAAKTFEDIAHVLVKSGLGDYGTAVNTIRENDVRSVFEAEFLLDGLYNGVVARTLKGMDEGAIMTKAFGIVIDLANIQVVFRSALMEGAGSFGEFITGGGHMLSEDTVRELFALKPNELAGRLENTEYLTAAQETLKNYEKERSVTVIDRVLEKHRIKLLRELLSPRALSPSNLLWYLFVKELEVRNLRLLFKTLMDGIPPSDVRDYVVTVS